MRTMAVPCGLGPRALTSGPYASRRARWMAGIFTGLVSSGTSTSLGSSETEPVAQGGGGTEGVSFEAHAPAAADKPAIAHAEARRRVRRGGPMQQSKRSLTRRLRFRLTDSEFCCQDLHGDKAVRTELTNHLSLARAAASLSSAGHDACLVGDEPLRLPCSSNSLLDGRHRGIARAAGREPQLHRGIEQSRERGQWRADSEV